MSDKYVYLFSEGDSSMRNLLGGKGAGLAEMSSIGMPVPPGFTITTEACIRYYDDGESIAPEIEAQIFEYLKKLEGIIGKKLGDTSNPLLLSVRSGARASMPGMMSTILNLGICDTVAESLSKKTGNTRFVYDSYRRFIQMYSSVVMDTPKQGFDHFIEKAREKRGVKHDCELLAEDMVELVRVFKQHYKEQTGSDFPTDPSVQLLESIKAVFRSWNSPPAVSYRRLNDIPSSWGTAVNIQAMVFGNMSSRSGTGVGFSRNPSTGEKKLYGEYLTNAQGEDVVAGTHTPEPIEKLKQIMPEVYNQFAECAKKLDSHYKDMQDMEFTIEDGKLYMLQTRNGKRTAQAALKIACDLVAEGMCSKEDALLKIDPKQLDTLLHPQFEPRALNDAAAIASGLPASPGAASGGIYFSAEAAVNAAKTKKVILVRAETSPEDIEGMYAAHGILTQRGGMTSHAAVVARGMGKCCVVGCCDLVIYEEEKYVLVNGLRLNEGDVISVDGTEGKIYVGELPTVEAQITKEFATIMAWSDEFRKLKVRTNADTPADAKAAIDFGAEGIGLTRTEHMFFEVERIGPMREMILSSSEEQRRTALSKLLPMQRFDFEGLFKVMDGRPVTIRLLDPPLHEFVPTNDADIRALANQMGISYDEVKVAIDNLHEFNPMLGHRGCRLAISYPEIAEMQTRAIIEAAINVKRETGQDVVPEIMVPLVGDVKEYIFLKKIIVETADRLIAEAGIALQYLVGTMIEIPRACLTADEIAKEADFFSFGTNDLTQMCYGFSRDDSGKFFDDYFKNKIMDSDPFAKLDQTGTGKLVNIAVELGRSANTALKIGICGEHGGDPSSVDFFHRAGLDYVSCSPFRVPIARLAAAHAVINAARSTKDLGQV